MNDCLFQNKNSALILYTIIDKEKQYKNLEKVSRKMFDYYFKDQEKAVLVYDNNGKPSIVKNDTYISISHSKDIVLCSIANTPIGIDIEFKRAISRKCFEFATKLYKTILPVRSLKDWVMLEATLKLEGLRLDNFNSHNTIAKNIQYKEIDFFKNYITVLSSKNKVDHMLLKQLPYAKIISYARHKNLS